MQLKLKITLVSIVILAAVISANLPEAEAAHTLVISPQMGPPNTTFDISSVIPSASVDDSVNTRIFVYFDSDVDLSVPTLPSGCNAIAPEPGDRLWELRDANSRIQAIQRAYQPSTLVIDSAFGNGDPSDTETDAFASFLDAESPPIRWEEIGSTGTIIGDPDDTLTPGLYNVITCGFDDVNGNGVFDATFDRANTVIESFQVLSEEVTNGNSEAIEPIDLGTLSEHSHSIAFGINDHNQIVGVSSNFDSISDKAVMWDQNFAIQDLGTVNGVGRSVARAINNNGQVVGISYTGIGGDHAFLWDNINGIQDLGALNPSSLSRAYDINDDGWVVGESIEPFGAHSPVLWHPVDGIQDLGIPDGFTSSTAVAINKQGQIVGWSTGGPGLSGGGFLWDSVNGMQDLSVLTGVDRFHPTDINDFGQILGKGRLGSEIDLILWDPVNGITDLGGLRSDVLTDWSSLNNAAVSTKWGDGTQDSLVGYVGKGTDSFQMLNPLSEDSMSTPYDVNNNGYVVGYSWSGVGSEHSAVLWKPDVDIIIDVPWVVIDRFLPNIIQIIDRVPTLCWEKASSPIPIGTGQSGKCHFENPCPCPDPRVCKAQLCSAKNFEQYQIFDFLKNERPKILHNLNIPNDKILPREGMVILESDMRDTVIRVTEQTGQKLNDTNPIWRFR